MPFFHPPSALLVVVGILRQVSFPVLLYVAQDFCIVPLGIPPVVLPEFFFVTMVVLSLACTNPFLVLMVVLSCVSSFLLKF